MKKQMKKQSKKQDYHPYFDIMLNALSNHDPENIERIKTYVAIRGKFGVGAAAEYDPGVHYIQIADPILRDIWNNLLQTIDTFYPAK